MSKQVLITGGAGFVGSHVADGLLRAGHRVRVLDDLTPQVHPGGKRPEYLSREVELVVGDVRDPRVLRQVLPGVEVIYHFAATVGVGQSNVRDQPLHEHQYAGHGRTAAGDP